MEFAQAYQQQDSSTMNSALKGIVAGVMMAGISTVLTFLGLVRQSISVIRRMRDAFEARGVDAVKQEASYKEVAKVREDKAR